MKKITHTFIALLLSIIAVGQGSSNDLVISGTVVDVNGMVVEGAEVCAFSDSISGFNYWECATTSANGTYFIVVQGGSVVGPNIDFSVFLNQSCGPNWLPSPPIVVSNMQGSVDQATADFVSCSNNMGGCSVSISVMPDSANLNGFWLTATPSGNGPFTYMWDNGSSTQTAYYINNGVILWDGCVTVMDADSCIATACDASWQNGGGNCYASFWMNGNNPAGGINAMDTVQAIYSGSSAPNNSYLWEVSGGGMMMTYTAQDPWIYFPTAGQYTICLTINDGFGCTDTYCSTVVVGGNTGNCDVSITSYTDSISGCEVLMAIPSGGTAPYVFDWTTGSTSGSITLCNTFPGDTICVWVTDANGCSAFSCAATGGGSGNCQASFYSYNDSLCMQPLDCFQFVDVSSGLNTLATAWSWDMGDGTTYNTQNPMHSYSAWGTYTVCLTVTMSDGCTSTYCDQIVVGGGSGNCDATFTYSGPTPIGYTFAANAPDSNLTYVWEMDGVVMGNGWDYYVPGFTPGTYTVCLTVYDNANCWDQYCMTITIPGGGPCEGYISGAVYAGSPNFPLDAGMVYLISFDAITNQLAAIDSMAVDSGNYYFFGPVPCGDYLIKAAASSNSAYYSDHIPTYFGNSPFWDFAETVTIDQANIQVTTDIILIAGANPGGPGFIGGDVTEGANKMGDIGDPVAGATVMLFDISSNAITYAYTDASGQFGFSNLAWGTYQVYVEMLNKTTTPVVVTIGPDQPSFEGVHVLVFDTEITTGIDEQKIVLTTTGLYPNPTNGNVSIELTSESAINLRVNIRDLTGRIIMNEPAILSAGGNKINLDVTRLSEGYYNVEFINVEGAVKLNEKLIVVD